MKIEPMDRSVYVRVEEMKSSEDLKKLLSLLVDYQMELIKTLNRILFDLTSENVTELDFGQTKTKNAANTLLKEYATKVFVTKNCYDKEYIDKNFARKDEVE